MTTTARPDLLSEQEHLRLPFLGSLVMHAGVFTLAFFYSWMLARDRISFGDPNALPGGSVPINIVKNIQLAPAQTAVENPVANDSRSSVPTPPPEKAKSKVPEKVEAEADALPLPSAKERKKVERRAPERKFRPYVPERDNQLYASKGMGVNTPSYTGLQPDAFGVGVGTGPGTPFGARYGWYVEALQRRIGEQWQRELIQVDARVRTAPRSVVFFEILRDGTVRGVRLAQSSGNPSVDYAALRAVTNANPVPPLPPDLGRSSVSTEIWFQLKR
ncbi:MAG: TonB family protein [Acidobacteria bacterium]|nr:TonB family protein [Acidobacteriota bacterium]